MRLLTMAIERGLIRPSLEDNKLGVTRLIRFAIAE